MSLMLLKCGTYPNAEADIGNHSFRYSLVPHKGSGREAEIVNSTYAFNYPLVVRKTAGGGKFKESFRFIQTRPMLLYQQ